MRRAAADALGYFTRASNKSIRPLLDALMDKRVEVRRTAILSLGRLGSGVAAVKETLTQLENDADPDIRTNVIIAKALIGSTDDSAIPSLIQALNSKDNPTAEAAGMALSRLGKQSPEKMIPALVEALNKNEQSLTRNALKVLKSMKHQAEAALPRMTAAYDKFDARRHDLWCSERSRK